MRPESPRCPRRKISTPRGTSAQIRVWRSLGRTAGFVIDCRHVRSSVHLSPAPGGSARRISRCRTPMAPSIRAPDVAGANGLLVVFACNHCPFVIHLADALGDLAREIALLRRRHGGDQFERHRPLPAGRTRADEGVLPPTTAGISPI